MTALASRPVSAPPPARGVWHVCAPAFVAVLAAAGVAALYRVFVLTSLGQTMDTAALRGAEVSHARAVEIMSRALNGTSLVSLVLVCVAAAAIGMVRRRIGLAVAAALMVLGANLSAQLLKMRLDRPDLDGFPAPNSFPSGHTTAAVSVAFALVLVLPSAIRGTVALIGAAYVTVIAVATVWAEWHRPSDTVAGAAARARLGRPGRHRAAHRAAPGPRRGRAAQPVRHPAVPDLRHHHRSGRAARPGRGRHVRTRRPRTWCPAASRSSPARR